MLGLKLFLIHLKIFFKLATDIMCYLSQVLLLRNCSSLEKTTSIMPIIFQKKFSSQSFSLLNRVCYSTYSSDELFSSSKRRSRDLLWLQRKHLKVFGTIYFSSDSQKEIRVIFLKVYRFILFCNLLLFHLISSLRIVLVLSH